MHLEKKVLIIQTLHLDEQREASYESYESQLKDAPIRAFVPIPQDVTDISH